MRLDRYQLELHLPWAVPACGLVVGLGIWYALASQHAGEWLQGGSLPALVCGIAAGSIVLFEMLLGLRKRLRAWRLLPARYWMAAHLWLGLISLPLACLHSGFRFGGWLPSILLLLLAIAFASGLLGWLLQHFIPVLMLKAVPAETITSEIEAVSTKNLADLKQMLTSAFGSSPTTTPSSMEHRTVELAVELETWVPAGAPMERALTIGAMRDRHRVSSFATVSIEPDMGDAGRVWQAYNFLMPYALRGQASGSWLSDQAAADKYFENLKLACDVSTSPTIDIIKSVCDQRRQFDVQRKLNVWLTFWIPIHVGLGTALSVLLVAHVITALRYW